MNYFNDKMYKYKHHNNYHDRYQDIERTQREILEQHKYLETQLNQLRENIANICKNNNCINEGINYPRQSKDNNLHKLYNKHNHFHDLI